VGAEQIRPQGKKQLFDAPAVAQTLLEQRDQGVGDVHAPAALALGERKHPSGVFIASGAGGTIFADAWLFDQSQRPFESGPKGGELSQEFLLEARDGIGSGFHGCMYIVTHTYLQEKNERIKNEFLKQSPR
jgi:hypothetical protein